jgi:malate dehydrogenase (oxaloacetate-decarboxylating)
MRDRNEVMFYRLLTEHLEEMLPIVYTPTVGMAIERYSHEYRRPRGVYLSVNHPEDVDESLRNYGLEGADVDLLVATDSEGIPGIGDQGVGGIDIAIGKLAVARPFTLPRPACTNAGSSRRCWTWARITCDCLTTRCTSANRHARVRDQRYDDLIDAYVRGVTKLFPHALLHWEDFGAGNAPADPEQVRRRRVHVQRRYARNCGGGAGRRDRRSEGFQQPDARSACRHLLGLAPPVWPSPTCCAMS